MPAPWTLLPDPRLVRVICRVSPANGIIARVIARVIARAEVIAPTVACPHCGRLATRIYFPRACCAA